MVKGGGSKKVSSIAIPLLLTSLQKEEQYHTRRNNTMRQFLSLFLVVAAVIMGISAADTAKEFLAWILPLLISWAQMPDISALINKVMVKGNGLI